jgi:AcrR family transcriptional regulator
MVKRALVKPRKSPRQTRSQATVEALLEAGARVLREDGYEKASVNRMAEVAGVSIGSLYQYFPSKDALVAAIIRRHSDRMLEVFQRDLLELGRLPIEDGVRGIVRRTFEAYALDPALRRIIVDEVPQFGLFTRSHEFDTMLAEALKGYFGFHAATIRPKNHELAVRILMASVEAIAQAVVVDDAAMLRSDELVDEVSHLVLGYIGRPGHT